MIEITIVALIEQSNLSYTTIIGTLSTNSVKRLHTFKVLVSKLLGGGGGVRTPPGCPNFWCPNLRGGGLGYLDNVQNLEGFF